MFSLRSFASWKCRSYQHQNHALPFQLIVISGHYTFGSFSHYPWYKHFFPIAVCCMVPKRCYFPSCASFMSPVRCGMHRMKDQQMTMALIYDLMTITYKYSCFYLRFSRLKQSNWLRNFFLPLTHLLGFPGQWWIWKGKFSF